jgi:8-oxo-dGTP diphosphatase
MIVNKDNKLKPGKDYIGVGGGVLILDDQDRTLLIKRAGDVKNEAGWWSKPGGTIDYGEKVIDAMKREIKEELDIEIEINGYLLHTDHVIKEDNQHWVAFNYIAKIESGKPKNMEPHKCDEISWFTLDNLPEKITQTTKEPIKNYLAGRYIKL